jgi:hypothetical protein
VAGDGGKGRDTVADDLTAFLDAVERQTKAATVECAPHPCVEAGVLVGMVRAVLSLPERLEARAAAEAISVTLGYNDLGRSAGLSEAAEIVRAALALPPSPTAEGTP